MVQQAEGIPEPDDEDCRPTRGDENKFKQSDFLTNLLERESDRMDTNRGSLIDDHAPPAPTLGGPISWSEVKTKMKFTMTQLVDKLHSRIAKETEDSVIATTKTPDDDHNQTLVRGALKRPTREVLVSKMDDDEVKVAYEAAIIQTATSPTMIKVVAKALVTEEAIMNSVVGFVASQARKEVSESAQQSIVTALPSPTPYSDETSSSDDDWKERKLKKYLRGKTKKVSASSRSEDKGTWTRRGSIKTSINRQVRAKRTICQPQN